MSRNVILLSDGTGNAASKIWRTNVWRLFQSLDLTTPNDPKIPLQVAAYDDGVGTSAFKPLAVLGGAFGWGLKRNVLELYKFLCRNYEADSQIYCFGFSRGAFTIRIVMGLVANQGIVTFSSESELHRNAKAAYRAYRSERFELERFTAKPLRALRALRDLIISLKNRVRGRAPYDTKNNSSIENIRFVGVWDTVAAYGLPIDEMTRGVDQWLWPLELPDRILSPKVQRACHALALDDERTTFHPVLWTEVNEKLAPRRAGGTRSIQDERLTQIWFVGAHSNVGGGYPDDSLAQIPLFWMMKEAQHCGLRFKIPPEADPDCLAQTRSARDKDGRVYDSRQGMGGYYRYGPRKIHDLSNDEDNKVSIPVPKIHESAVERIINGAHIYAPIGFPAKYDLVLEDGTIVENAKNPYESSDRALKRAESQELVWDYVWKRRVVYFATLAATFYLVFFPLFHQTDRSEEFSTHIRLVSETLRLVDAFVPNFFNWWINSYAANPWKFLLGIALVGGLIWLGTRVGSTMSDHMRAMWIAKSTIPERRNTWIFQLRNWTKYKTFIWFMKRRALPLISAVGIVYLISSISSHLIFNIQDSAGMYCEESPAPKSVPWGQTVDAATPFKANALCWPSGILIEEGQRYVITIKQTGPWSDGHIEADVGGVELMEIPNFSDRVRLFLATPLRRVFLRTWFVMIARIGTVGTDEYFLDQDKPTSLRQPKKEELTVPLPARRSGELFLYVNDAVIGVPFVRGIASYFLKNNHGEATVTISHRPR